MRINDRLVDAIQTPGKQLIVYGESGSGKSTLLLNKLDQLYEDHITTRCSYGSTFEQILLDAFDKLDRFYLGEQARTRNRQVSSSLEADFARVRAHVETARSASHQDTHHRILSPQLTPQRLGEFMGAQGLCWVLEDFHKIEAEEKRPLAQAFKVFSDLSRDYPSVKIVAIGATDTAREVVQYDREMNNRVAELPVPLMTDSELEGIISNGQRLLNIDLSALSHSFIKYATGVPSVVHQLALNVCLENQLMETSREHVGLGRDHLEAALERYVEESSDTLKATFQQAMKRHQVRRYDNGRLILTALAGGPLEGMRHSEILHEIRRVEKDYPPGNLTQYLQALCSDRRGKLLRYSDDSKYRFVDPLHHTYAQTVLRPDEQRVQTSADELEQRLAHILTKRAISGELILHFVGHGTARPSSKINHIWEDYQQRLLEAEYRSDEPDS